MHMHLIVNRVPRQYMITFFLTQIIIINLFIELQFSYNLLQDRTVSYYLYLIVNAVCIVYIFAL